MIITCNDPLEDGHILALYLSFSSNANTYKFINHLSIPFLPLRAIFQGRVVFDLPFAFLVSYRFFKPNTFFSKAFWLIWFVSSKKSGLLVSSRLGGANLHYTVFYEKVGQPLPGMVLSSKGHSKP